MSRVVFIGGFGNGKANGERVATALESRYDDVEDPFTFAYAMDNPDLVRRAVKGADVITHSAGMMALKGTNPECIGAIGAPLPLSSNKLLAGAKLVLKTGLKTARMHTPGIGIRSLEDVGAVAMYDASALAENAAHPRSNLGRLGQIAAFNAVDAAVAASDAGIKVLLGYNHGDEYFTLSPEEELRALKGGVSVTHMPGIHDELVLRPEQALADFFEVPIIGQDAAFDAITVPGDPPALG
jgi:hypothetical protein